jgi:hypothetical protein
MTTGEELDMREVKALVNITLNTVSKITSGLYIQTMQSETHTWSLGNGVAWLLCYYKNMDSLDRDVLRCHKSNVHLQRAISLVVEFRKYPCTRKSFIIK